MRRRSRADGEPAKTRSRKRAALKLARDAPPRRRRSADLLQQLDSRTRERDEALEREKALAEVLRIISTSPGELKPIFQAMLENAVRICEAIFGNLYLRDADGFHMVAAHHDSPAYVAARMSDPSSSPVSGPGRNSCGAYGVKADWRINRRVARIASAATVLSSWVAR